MAQLVEQLIRNQQVAGSSPATSSKKTQANRLGFFYLCPKETTSFDRGPISFLAKSYSLSAWDTNER